LLDRFLFGPQVGDCAQVDEYDTTARFTILGRLDNVSELGPGDRLRRRAVGHRDRRRPHPATGEHPWALAIPSSRSASCPQPAITPSAISRCHAPGRHGILKLHRRCPPVEGEPDAWRGRSWQFGDASPPPPSDPSAQNVPIIDLEERIHRAI
jgi:hypothetical protein